MPKPPPHRCAHSPPTSPTNSAAAAAGRPHYYSVLSQPSLSMKELELTVKTLDHDATDMLIDKWLEHRGGAGPGDDSYSEWFKGVRERKHLATNNSVRQAIIWNKGDFVPENVFCRTVDTGRLIPLDRTWTTHVYHHKSMSERRLSMMPVVFTMLPELMLLRGMHDVGCDDIYIIVTDLKRQEMDDITEYFKLICGHAYGRACKPSIEQTIRYEHMRLTHTLARQRRTPCFPQIDLTFRALLHEKQPPFLILFSHQTTSYSQILFTHPSYVPAEEIFYDFPSGCPNPCCTDDCEMIRFPRRGVSGAQVMRVRRGGRWGRRVREREMCNWIDCDVCFGEEVFGSDGGHAHQRGEGEGEGESVVGDRDRDGEASSESGSSQQEGEEGEGVMPPSSGDKAAAGQVCSKCKLVKYCSVEHQRKDWEEHRRVCVKAQ